MARTDIKVCEGMRKSGTCGNRYNTENFNKKCAGRNCPFRFGAYVTKDGGGYVQPANYATIQKQKEMDKKFGVVVPEVVEENRAVAVVKKTQKPTEGVVVKTIAKQIEVVRGAELRSNFEKLKLGAMVSQAVTLLGMDSKGGNGSKGDGVKGWWEKNFKDKDGEAFIPYRTVHSWVEAARNLPALIGGSASADPDAVMKLLAKNPTKVVGKDAKILASAEKLANGMTMRQMLLWGGDAEPDRRGGKGRPKGTKADLSKKPDSTDTIAAARAVWSQVIVPAEKTFPALESAVKLLNAADVENAKIILQNLMDLLNEQEKALKPNVH